jgi:transposase
MLKLRDEQWERIREHFPEENVPDSRPGRKPIPTRRVLEAVLWILNTGAQWHMLPQNLIGDRAYDSDQLDEQLRREGVEMIAPHRSNRKRKTQDGRRLRRYERRWIVERFFAWIQWRRRLLVRWEYYPINFLGFVQLAAICILLRQF